RAPWAQAARKFDAADLRRRIVRKHDERLQGVVEVPRRHRQPDLATPERPRAFEVPDARLVQANARKREWRRSGAERGRRQKGGGCGQTQWTDPRRKRHGKTSATGVFAGLLEPTMSGAEGFRMPTGRAQWKARTARTTTLRPVTSMARLTKRSLGITAPPPCSRAFFASTCE